MNRRAITVIVFFGVLLVGVAVGSLAQSVPGNSSPANASPDKKDKSEGKLLFGKVLDTQDNPLPDSVVYLTNTRNRSVKTYIVNQDGTYRFPALSASIDYEVYAQYKGHKSDTKSVSQFDQRPQVYLDLKIDTH
jgi:Carboxypeptidase regulatory-like domain